MKQVDVAIVGGGPAGLSAALILGRARRRVFVFDAGERRNAAAVHMQGFVSRDGVSPQEFRRIAGEQLAPYDVQVVEARVQSIQRDGERFRVEAGDHVVHARRVLLATGVIDELPSLPGVRELWGKSIFGCPYCHGWEIRDQKFAVLATNPHALDYAILVGNWSKDVIAFTDAKFEVPPDQRARLERVGIRLEQRAIKSLHHDGNRLSAIALKDGAQIEREILFAAGPQHQTQLVKGLGLALDEYGFVRVNEQRETSVPGIYAGGDLITKMQSAVVAAGAGAAAAYSINFSLSMERAG